MINSSNYFWRHSTQRALLCLSADYINENDSNANIAIGINNAAITIQMGSIAAGRFGNIWHAKWCTTRCYLLISIRSGSTSLVGRLLCISLHQLYIHTPGWASSGEFAFDLLSTEKVERKPPFTVSFFDVPFLGLCARDGQIWWRSNISCEWATRSCNHSQRSYRSYGMLVWFTRHEWTAAAHEGMDCAHQTWWM